MSGEPRQYRTGRYWRLHDDLIEHCLADGQIDPRERALLRDHEHYGLAVESAIDLLRQERVARTTVRLLPAWLIDTLAVAGLPRIPRALRLTPSATATPCEGTAAAD